MAKGAVGASEGKVMITVWDVSGVSTILACRHQSLFPSLALLLTLQP